MVATLRQMLSTPSPVRSRIFRLYGLLIAFNVAAWGLALIAAIQYPILLPTAFLAYTFGLRHAVDADHIAAIDNTTRKLMQDGQRPVGVGLFFSLGHSTIVIALSVLLVVIGIINLVVLIDIYRMFRRVSKGGAYDEQSLEEFLGNRGLLARLF